jgi:hypothetical protein
MHAGADTARASGFKRAQHVQAASSSDVRCWHCRDSRLSTSCADCAFKALHIKVLHKARLLRSYPMHVPGNTVYGRRMNASVHDMA